MQNSKMGCSTSKNYEEEVVFHDIANSNSELKIEHETGRPMTYQPRIESAPSEPQNLCIKMDDNGKGHLCWTPPDIEMYSLIMEYIVCRFSHSEQKMVQEKIISGEITDCSLSDFFIHYNSKNKFGVLARNSFGHSKMSTITLKPPSAPVGILEDISDSGMILSWNPPCSDGGAPITHYKIYQFSTMEHKMVHMETLGDVYHYKIPNVKDKTERKYGIQAMNIIGKGPITTVKVTNYEKRKNKSEPTVANKIEKDVSATQNNSPESDEDARERPIYVSTYYHKFDKGCDMQGCLDPLTVDSAVLTLQCQHKICYNCYDKVEPFLQWDYLLETYEIKCMVCGVYSSVEICKDGENKIRYLKTKENETEIPGDRKTKSKPPVTNKMDTDVIASKNDSSDSDKDTPEKATNISALYDEFGKHCDMRGCLIPLTDETVVLTLQCQHKICFNCYDKVQPFLRQNEIFQTYEIKCMVCGVYSSVDICQDDKNNIIYLHCRETNAEKTMKADLVHSKLKGIPNIGSTCYANCILQVLGQTPNLVFSLQSLMKQFLNIKKLPISSMLLTILQKFECDDGMYVDTRLIQDLITEIHSVDQSFERFRQNDCHSFLICLFNGIQDEIISAHGELKKKTFKNPLEMFEGKMYNSFKYLPCNHSEQSEDQVFTSLLIPIQEKRTNGQQEQWSIEKGLRLMMGSEEFDGEVLPCLTCENTGATSPGKKITTKTFGISEPPAILILQLGRFREVRGRLRKVDCDITYEKNLDFEVINHRTQIPACVKYELYSVVLHYGSLESGHYYSHVKSKTSGQWFTCSDRYVRKIQDPFEWGFREAYLLFYRRSNY